MEIINVPYLSDFKGRLIAAFPQGTYWSLEDSEDSTNRLKLEVPLDFSVNVMSEQEILFMNRRFLISEVNIDRFNKAINIDADELQILLSTKLVKKFTLENTPIRDAALMALSGTGWSVGTVNDDRVGYNADLENKSVMHCLQFLSAQSGMRLQFNSKNYSVNIISGDNTIIDKVFSYRKNLENVSKTESQPTATIMYPYGRDGLSIADVNNGIEYLEDFSWYLNFGMTLEEARARFSKEVTWENQNFEHAGNLIVQAKRKLAELSRPKIGYHIEGALFDDSLQLGDYVYVSDEQLNIRIKAKVSRIRRSVNENENELELDYITESLGADSGTVFGDSNPPVTTTIVNEVVNEVVNEIVFNEIVNVIEHEVLVADTSHILNSWIRYLNVEFLETNFEALDIRLPHPSNNRRYYIRIEGINVHHIEAELSATETENYTTPYGDQIYWTAIDDHLQAYKYFTITDPINVHPDASKMNEDEKETIRERFRVKVRKTIRESVKKSDSFDEIPAIEGTTIAPRTTYGEGDEAGNGKGVIYKSWNDMNFSYTIRKPLGDLPAGSEIGIRIDDNGVWIFNALTGEWTQGGNFGGFSELEISESSFSIIADGKTFEFETPKDDLGRIVSVNGGGLDRPIRYT